MNNLSPFDYWVEYLAVTEQWEDAWAATYDTAISNWQLALCWRLLREARRLAIHPSQQAPVRFREGILHTMVGNWQRAADCYEFALANAGTDDYDLHLSLLGEMGMLHRLYGNHDRALALHQRQYELARTAADLWYQATALDNTGLDYEAANRLDEARQSVEKALQLWRELKVESGIVSALKHLGLIAWRQENWEAAEDYFIQAQKMAVANEQYYDLAQIEGNLGNLAYEREQWDEAETCYTQALSRFDKLGVVFDKIGIINNLGGIAVARHEYDQAQMLYGESLTLAQTLGYRQGELDALLNLGLVALRQRRWADVPGLYKQAVSAAHALGDRRTVWHIRRRQLRFITHYGLMRLLSWIRDRFTKEMEVK